MNKRDARSIDDVLHFRTDISPFLVHLTRARRQNGVKSSARGNLEAIIRMRELVPSGYATSDLVYAGNQRALKAGEVVRFFGAICFTETPLSEVHCLLDIKGRQIQLEPYGLVFQLRRLVEKSVNPVVYINNAAGQNLSMLQGLFELTTTAPEVAEKLLPLVAFFGKYATKPGDSPSELELDFRWERAWRRPAALGPMAFDAEDVFVGLCPHNERSAFEKLFPGVEFIDPLRPARWYARQLVAARKRCKLEYSVV